MKRILITISTVLAALWFGFGSLSCQRNDSGTIETIVISYAPFETLALLWTADEKGFFTQNGINATLRQYDTGAGSLDAVLKGEADIAVGTAEFPLVARAFKKEKIRAIASIDKIEFITSEKEVPNFSDYIYENTLKAVKPEAVNIIR